MMHKGVWERWAAFRTPRTPRTHGQQREMRLPAIIYFRQEHYPDMRIVFHTAAMHLVTKALTCQCSHAEQLGAYRHLSVMVMVVPLMVY